MTGVTGAGPAGPNARPAGHLVCLLRHLISLLPNSIPKTARPPTNKPGHLERGWVYCFWVAKRYAIVHGGKNLFHGTWQKQKGQSLLTYLVHMDERFPTRRHIADCPLLQSFDIIVLAI